MKTYRPDYQKRAIVFVAVAIGLVLLARLLAPSDQAGEYAVFWAMFGWVAVFNLAGCALKLQAQVWELQASVHDLLAREIRVRWGEETDAPR